MEGKVYSVDNSDVTIVDESGLDLDPKELVASFTRLDVQQSAEVASLQNWARQNASEVRYRGNWGRDVFLDADDVFKQFDVARRAAERDDIVSGVVESTEALIMKKVRVNCENEDQENIFNQILTDIEFSRTIREIWRESFMLSQCYIGVYWGTKSYTPTNKTDSKNARSRKKSVSLRVPTGITVLNPVKIIPYGSSMFKQDSLIYLATREEAKQFDSVLAGSSEDKIVTSLIASKIKLTRQERQSIKNEVSKNVNLNNVYLMNEANVFKFTYTKPDYKRFADVRMRSVFELLDLKHQLKAMDRAFLVGGTNMIVLVKKGTDSLPAKGSEITALASQVQRSSRTPVIVGDHRLEVEIVTPRLDKTLAAERYNAIDSRITSRLYNILSSGNYASGVAADDSVKLLGVIARNLEAKREDIGLFLTNSVIKQVVMRNIDFFDSRVEINFHPKRVAVSNIDVGFMRMLVDLHLAGRISHHTLLDEFDIDYEQEKIYRQLEKKDDELWKPKDSDMDSQRVAGQIKGGERQPGGGNNPASGSPSPNNQPSRNPNQVDNDKKNDDS